MPPLYLGGNSFTITLFYHLLAADYADLDDPPAVGAPYRYIEGAFHRPFRYGADHGVDIVQPPVEGIEPVFQLLQVGRRFFQSAFRFLCQIALLIV